MFKKIFLVALVLCVCYFGGISARPDLPKLPLVGSVGNLPNTAGSLVTGAATGAAGGATGGLLGSQLGGGGLPLLSRGGDVLPL